MTSLKLEMDPGDIAKVKLMLGALSKAGDTVIKQAVNRTLSGVRTDSVKEMSKVVTATKTTIRETIKVEKLTAKDGIAYVKSTGKSMDLSYFRARQTKKGVTVQVLRKSGRSLIKHAYIVEVENPKAGTTHKAVVWRKKWGGERSKKKLRKVGGYRWYANLPYKYRYKMKGLKTMGIPDVMGYPPTMNELLRLGGIRLKKNLNDRLDYELSKLK